MTPNTLPPSRRGPDCPPAATLEAMSAGEVVPASVGAHVGACAGCSAQLEALRAEMAAFNRVRPPERFLRQLERREAAPRRSGLRRLLPALAVAVPVVLALVVVPRLRERPEVVLKGGGFRVAVLRAGAVGPPELVASDAVVGAGDALRFAYEAPAEGHLLVLDLDGRGDASVLHPFGAATSAPLGAARREFLPGSVVLDDAPGPEIVVAVFSTRPVEAAPLLAALRAQEGRPEPTVACDGCRVTVLRLQKRP